MWLKILGTVLIIGILVCVYSIWHASTHFRSVYYKLSSSKLQKPLKIVVLSDLHDKQYGEHNQKVLHAVEAEQPDLVLIAGDMLTALLHREKVAEQLVAALSAAYPVYYGPGNHESKMKWDREYYGERYEEYLKDIKAAGAIMLRNEYVEVKDCPIRIYGLDIAEAYYKRFKQTPMKENYLEAKLGAADTGFYNILLAHNPMYFKNYARWKPDLVLSGHVHGGLVKVPFLGGVIAPNLHLFPEYDGGLFHEGSSDMIISRGMGIHSIEFRMWNPGELVVIELVPAKD